MTLVRCSHSPPRAGASKLQQPLWPDLMQTLTSLQLPRGTGESDPEPPGFGAHGVRFEDQRQGLGGAHRSMAFPSSSPTHTPSGLFSGVVIPYRASGESSCDGDTGCAFISDQEALQWGLLPFLSCTLLSSSPSCHLRMNPFTPNKPGAGALGLRLCFLTQNCLQKYERYSSVLIIN